MPVTRPDFRQLLGEQLLQCRTGAGLSGRTLAAILGCDQSRISRIESGKTQTSLEEVERWLQETGASAAHRTEASRLIKLVAQEVTTSRRSLSVDGWTSRRTDRAAIEAEASRILVWQESFVPDLLQTAAYAHHFIRSTTSRSGQHIAGRILSLVTRQDVLYGADAGIEFVIFEAALRQRIGNYPIMIDQLSRISSLARQGCIEIWVLPEEESTTEQLHPNFTVYRAPRDGSADLVVTIGESRPQSRRSVVQHHIDQFSVYQSRSLRSDQAIEFIDDLAREMSDGLSRPAGPVVGRDGA